MFEFNERQNINNEEDFAKELMDKALTGEHTKREYLRNSSELSVARVLRFATKQIVAGFKAAAKNAFTSYVNNLKNNIDDLSLLLTHITYKKCAEYYQKELDLVRDEIDEFYNYAFFSGHFIDIVICGFDRPNEHLYDSRINSWLYTQSDDKKNHDE